MIIMGVDYHLSFQTIAFLVEETGEYDERELNHSDGEAERFYRELKERGVSVRVGMEATGHARWFERLLAELGFATRSTARPCLARVKSALEMNNTQIGHVACCKEEIQLLGSFGEQQDKIDGPEVWRNAFLKE